MDQPRASSPLLPENRVAMTLVLFGLGGLCYHFAIKPDSATSATAPGPAPGPYTAPVAALARGDRGTSPAADEVKEMRRRLREFIIPLPGIKALPVTDTLALLENH